MNKDLKDNLFIQLCNEAEAVAHMFGFGILRAPTNMIVYITSPHMAQSSNALLPNNGQHFLELDKKSDRYTLWRIPTINKRRNVIVLGSPVEARLKYLDTEQLEDTAARLVHAVDTFEKNMDADDQRNAILSITNSRAVLSNIR